MALGALVHANDAPTTGHEICPCLEGPLDMDERFVPAEAQDNLYSEYLNENLVGSNLSSTFGVGCKAHNDEIGYCKFLGEACDTSNPKPKECDDVEWCKMQFCFIEAKNCALAHRSIDSFRYLDYSFATCGNMDHFTQTSRRNSLWGKSLKVAYAANTGGYVGAYNVNGSFAFNDGWSGPAVDFVAEVAKSSNFNIEMVAPPDFLIEPAKEFFNSTSHFDLCAYAVSLGYVDLCVGSFTLSSSRVSSGKFMKLAKNPIYLITFANEEKSWINEFFTDAILLLTPFSANVWLFMFLFVIPVMSLLMFKSEYGLEDGAFPDKDKMSILNYIGHSLYEVLLSLFAGYGQDVVSRSGKAHLLGIGFFNMIVLSVYTANLAAILTANESIETPITLKNIRNNGMKICTGRLHAEQIAYTDPFVTDLLLKDPIDGLPGFTSRGLLYERMKRNVDPSERDLFCEVVIATEEDIITEHGEGLHCDKVIVGDILSFSTTGFPISPLYSEPLWSALQKSVNGGVYAAILQEYKPVSQCPATTASSNSNELLITHLAGVWIVPILCSIVGFFIHLVEKKKSIEKNVIKSYEEDLKLDMEQVAADNKIE